MGDCSWKLTHIWPQSNRHGDSPSWNGQQTFQQTNCGRGWCGRATLMAGVGLSDVTGRHNIAPVICAVLFMKYWNCGAPLLPRLEDQAEWHRHSAVSVPQSRPGPNLWPKVYRQIQQQASISLTAKALGTEQHSSKWYWQPWQDKGFFQLVSLRAVCEPHHWQLLIIIRAIICSFIIHPTFMCSSVFKKKIDS